jgi:homogentisate 1,2-dioxygenase
MAFYVQRGRVPSKRHIQFRDEKGNLYYEELVSREGFSDVYANMYHVYPPTEVSKVGEFQPIPLVEAKSQPHRHHHFETFKLKPLGNWVSGRRAIAFNDDVAMFTASPRDAGDFFYRNGNADEVLFIHRGTGTMESTHGVMKFAPGDYIVIPRGITYRMNFDSGEVRLFVVESAGPVQVPKHYRNEHGQMEEHAPYSERDFRVPEFRDAVDERGDFPLQLKLRAGIQHMALAHHPFDVVGWDGYYYPFIFNINDYMPKVGKVHLPPPTHLTFNAPGFVLCSFCPRPFDFHEHAVPIPYAHSNVDSEEVLYYVEGNFMSRRGIEVGSVTLHPAGMPHGPQPGLIEKALGAKETNELAVMVDTFRPLKTAQPCMEVDDPKYPYSWLEG